MPALTEPTVDLARDAIVDAVAQVRFMVTERNIPTDLLEAWWADWCRGIATGGVQPSEWFHHRVLDNPDWSPPHSSDFRGAALGLIRIGTSLDDPTRLLPLLATDLPDGTILTAAALLNPAEIEAIATGDQAIDLPAWTLLATLHGIRLPDPAATGHIAPQYRS